MTELHKLQEIASLARRSIEPGLLGNGSSGASSAGACLHGCLVVVLLLKRFGGGFPIVRGGADGAIDTAGNWHGHYWVEVVTQDGSAFVVDITADQFGYEPVVVVPISATGGRYRPGPQREVDEAFVALAAELGCVDLALA